MVDSGVHGFMPCVSSDPLVSLRPHMLRASFSRHYCASVSNLC
jgi:hypothetical protein